MPDLSQLEAEPNYWRKCNSCKKEIAYGATYYVCNVSTCNRKRTGLVFCEVSCWDAHIPLVNHRESWAEEERAPSKSQWEAILAAEKLPKKRGPRDQPIEEKKPETPAARPVVLRRPKSD
jgi:hypothetical protein